MARGTSQRFVLGLEGPELDSRERDFFSANPPLGFLLFRRNLSSASQAVSLIAELHALASPPPLLFVDQEGGTVDRIGPLLDVSFPSAAHVSSRGTAWVHECAYLMGRAARLLGFDVDFAPVLDLAQPGTGAVVLEGRCFGFHPEDVILSGMVFLHGLARAGVATCVKHFPGLGRGPVDSHVSLPVVEANDVDLMVTDLHPFSRLSRRADGIMVAHAAYPGITGDSVPASLSPIIYDLLRKRLDFKAVAYTDDLTMGALGGTLADRSAAAATAGTDVLVIGKGIDQYEECVARVAEASGLPAAVSRRIDALRSRCRDAPRPPFTPEAWRALAAEVTDFQESLERVKERKTEEKFS